jgi:pimeloyl-ACP methyl ester carboxylesterase
MTLNHRNVKVAGISLHVVEAGPPDAPTVLFLHGWPECWVAFKQIMPALGERAHCLAIDLPGIGGSEMPPIANDKRALATYVRGLIETLGLRGVTLVGHDVGAQIVYAYLHEYPNELAAAALMNIVIPGVDPWSEVVRNPSIWHFAFHAIPELPEVLVTGRQAAYFDYFYDLLSATRTGVTGQSRQAYVAAYSRPEAMRTGFDWYRAFAQDEKDNRASQGLRIETPVLCIRGDREYGDLERYVAGLRTAGLRNVTGRLIRACGHFGPDEQPVEVATMISDFIPHRRVNDIQSPVSHDVDVK